MVDFTLIVLIVASAFFGLKTHSPRFTPYIASLGLGFLLAICLHTPLTTAINRKTHLDFAFSASFSFALLLLLGSIVFYGFLLLYHRIDRERADRLYSGFSKANLVAVPLIVTVVFCILASVISELPTNAPIIKTFQEMTNSSRSVRAFKRLVQTAGIQSDIVKRLAQVPLSQKEETSENAVPLAFKSTSISYDQSVEYEMLNKINEQRVNNHLEKLTYKNELANVGRDHSIDMLQRRYFAHINLEGKTPFDRLHSAGIGYGLAGENLAISTKIDNAVAALMQSPTHRANILNAKFSKTGIGIAINQDGIMAISQEFTD